MTFKKVVFYIVIVILFVVVGYSVIHKMPVATAPVVPVTTPGSTSTTTTIANYSCDSGKTIAASFSNNDATITLSDGRTLTLPHTVSADGAQYGSGTVLFVTKGDQGFLQENANTTYDNCIVNSSGSAVSGIKSFTDQGHTFTLNYPANLTLAGGGIGYTQNWKVDTDSTLGLILVTLKSPANYMPKTNLGDVKFSIGTSSDPKAVASCLTDTSGAGVIKSTVAYNGINYTKLVTVDAGAGNRYETNSYRTVQHGQCYAVEYTVHYAVLENFDPSMGIKQYDVAKVHADFDGIVQSLKFLSQ